METPRNLPSNIQLAERKTYKTRSQTKRENTGDNTLLIDVGPPVKKLKKSVVSNENMKLDSISDQNVRSAHPSDTVYSQNHQSTTALLTPHYAEKLTNKMDSEASQSTSRTSSLSSPTSLGSSLVSLQSKSSEESTFLASDEDNIVIIPNESVLDHWHQHSEGYSYSTQDDENECNFVSSQELMPPPHSLDIGQRLVDSDERSRSRTRSQLGPVKRKRRSSSRSTLILSDDECEHQKHKKEEYLKRSSSKTLKKDTNLMLSASSQDSSCSTVLINSSSNESISDKAISS